MPTPHEYGRTHLGSFNAKRFTPPIDRRVDSRKVRCPHCGVPPREECVSLLTGKPRTNHPQRRVMALRAERNEA